MIHEHEKIKCSPKNPGCNLKTVIAAIMLWSDSTHLVSFRNTSLWPIYLFLGNQSKYMRAKPTTFAAHHLAYIPKLSNTIQDFYLKTFGTSATASVLTHCKRELMQAIWSFLLDSDFLHAYEYGIVVKFADGILWRVFLCLFTYAADYPEKILLACMKFLGNCPCPHCLVTKDKICKLGMKNDQGVCTKKAWVDTEACHWLIENVHRAIFEFGQSITSRAIKRILGPASLVPTRLSALGFNFYSMLVPDFMHEFELGIWKATLMHLIRLLYEVGNDAVQEFNTRFRLVPTFGRDTIRKFSSNVSGLTKLAARDFEDILQCAIPVFDSLLPEPYNTIIINLLFELATWHAFGKLQMHTETTLYHFDNCMTRLGQDIRRFSRDCCTKFNTYDLPRETAARAQHRGAKNAKAGTTSDVTSTSEGRKQRTFNMSTYKLHALGDYVKAIREFSTTDNYSTQVGELEHRRIKRFYSRTNKIGFTRAITKHQQRERLLHKIREENRALVKADEGALDPSTASTERPSLHFVDQEPLPNCPPDAHYQMSQGKKFHWELSAWLSRNKKDKAVEGFLPKLKNHILWHLMLSGEPGNEDDEFTQAQHNALAIVNNRIYRHKVLRINYTMYDLRWAQDLLNPRMHSDVMVLSHEDTENPHPYWYAWIIGIFHVDVRYRGPEIPDHAPKRIDLLWVRWFACHTHSKCGWAVCRLPQVGFYPQDDTNAFGFIDPDDVVRGVHLIPAFRFGHTTALLPLSITRRKSDNDEDWDWYYMNMYLCGSRHVYEVSWGGVGHKSTHEATRCLLDDHEILDKEPFTLENDCDPFQGTGEDDVPVEGSSSSEEEESDESGEHGSDMDSVDGGDDQPLIGDELADEMDEYRYTGLDQTLDKNEGDAEISGDEDALGPEDGKDPDKINDTVL
ncbi:hypothetical protein SCLCIDRAFT_24518 [Scleroderma citrinum Foug A]|uniref:Uncharacterized protein n=1 Tax=Scleroderma citrinum Foug A TaxID=1036808 RepID=A0A0C3E3X3_9AGAM|nr:hypothetical protein SCLCIDRAFT_24518 [Scleroderma citrinum Foug A]